MDIRALRRRVSYNPETGKLVWKKRPRSDFKSDRAFNAFNTAHAGKEAFACLDRGYCTGTMGGKKVRAHRAAFAIMKGYWPDEVDHINGDTSDNRWQNLREVTKEGNAKNRKLDVRNRSGCAGVYQRKDNGKWVAGYNCGKKRIHIGQFETLDEAVAARKAAEKIAGYHRNHGRTNHD